MNEAEFREYLDGVHAIGDVAQAVAILADAEEVLALLDPVDAVLTPVVMALNVLHSLDAKYIAYGCAGTAYALMFGATGSGSTDYPTGSYSLEDDETIALKRQHWSDGVSAAQLKLDGSQSGVALKNAILLHVAQNDGNPEPVLQEMWACLCKEFDIENPYSEQMRLLWPDTGITENSQDVAALTT
jgi:hypothetical protein